MTEPRATRRAGAAALLGLALIATGCALLQPRSRSESQGQQGQQGQQQGQAEPEARSGERYDLDPRYRPLVAIVERPPLPGMSNTAATTISPEVYVVDLQVWLKKHPPGTPLFEGVIRHEQLHARRQEAYPGGVDAWVQRYLNDVQFMWVEEQLGWAEQIKHLRYGNLQINVDGVAKNLSRYRNLEGSMVSYDEAKRWVEDVLANRWQAPR